MSTRAEPAPAGPPRGLRATGLALLVLAALSSGCAAIPADAPYDVAALSLEAQAESELMARLSSAALPFRGLVPMADDRAWRIGDELLYGIEATVRGERTTWILGLRVEAPERSPGQAYYFRRGRVVADARARADLAAGATDLERRDAVDFVFHGTLTPPDGGPSRAIDLHSDSLVLSTTLYGPDGEVVDQDQSLVPADYLRTGYHEPSEVLLAGGSAEDGAGLEAIAGAMAALFSMLGVVQENRALEPILWKVVQKPSALSLISGLGVKVSIQPALDDVVRVDGASVHLPGETTYRFPVQFVVNGGVALRATLTCSATRAPRNVGAGIVAADGVHPTDPTRRVALRLLASRRGVGGGSER